MDLRRIAWSIASATLLVVVGAVFVARPDVVSARRSAVRYDAEGIAPGPLEATARRPNLIVLVVDTLRADALAARPDGGLMPRLARVAEEGVAYLDASAAAPWTLPSVASLLTGLLPSELGLLDFRRPPAVPPAVTTYAEVLSRSFGYDTAAFVDAMWFTPQSGVLQGFRTSGMGFHLQAIDHFVGPWADARDRTRPFFLLLHSNEAHAPYGAANHAWPPSREAGGDAPLPAELEGWEAARIAFLDGSRRDAIARRMGPRFSQAVVRYTACEYAERPRPELAGELRSAYEDGLRWFDGVLGRALDRLGARGLLDDTLLVVLGDHGESFGEHGQLGHGRQLYDELVRVPLVMRGPAPFRGGRVARGSASLLDVMPTFFEWIGAAPPAETHGESLLGALRGDASDRPAVAEEELGFENCQRPVDACLGSVRTQRWKYVGLRHRATGAVEEELYDLASDPGERRNLLERSDAPPDLPAEVCGAVRDLRARLGLRAHGPGESEAIARAPCD